MKDAKVALQIRVVNWKRALAGQLTPRLLRIVLWLCVAFWDCLPQSLASLVLTLVNGGTVLHVYYLVPSLHSPLMASLICLRLVACVEQMLS